MTLQLTKNRLLPFPVRRIYCVGRNYAEHRKEMGGSDRDLPFFFMKPGDAVFQSQTLIYPKNTTQLDYEAELVAVMGDDKSIFGFALGVDLTKRDLQSACKKQSRPWECAKSFDLSALIGDIVPITDISGGMDAVMQSRLTMDLNGSIKQSALVSDMIWSTAELVDQLDAQDFSVKKGDFIFTGTPAGVGEVKIGDTCKVSLTLKNNQTVPILKFQVISG